MRTAGRQHSPAELARVAYHEAGHTVVAWRLGGSVLGPVSVVATAHSLGIAYVVGADAPHLTLRYVRRAFKHEVAINLAGHAAERWAPDSLAEQPPLPVPPPPGLQPLSEREGALMARRAAAIQPSEYSDLVLAFEAAEALVGEGPAAYALVRRMERAAARLLASSAAQAQLHRLAAALIRHHTLSAAAVRQLLTETTEEVAA